MAYPNPLDLSLGVSCFLSCCRKYFFSFVSFRNLCNFILSCWLFLNSFALDGCPPLNLVQCRVWLWACPWLWVLRFPEQFVNILLGNIYCFGITQSFNILLIKIQFFPKHNIQFTSCINITILSQHTQLVLWSIFNPLGGCFLLPSRCHLAPYVSFSSSSSGSVAVCFPPYFSYSWLLCSGWPSFPILSSLSFSSFSTSNAFCLSKIYPLPVMVAYNGCNRSWSWDHSFSVQFLPVPNLTAQGNSKGLGNFDVELGVAFPLMVELPVFEHLAVILQVPLV